ncbi:transmembrane transport protein [Streptomyces sp. NPDC004610]|uniref:transmembrane transport protein n=1 Tax=unclassified Streptomyces TaxID=2593676 RepID=UPI0033ABA16B
MTRHPHPNPNPAPDPSPMTPENIPEALERALAAEVSLAARVRRLAVGLAGATGAALLAVLWATEPEPLPAATATVFALLIAVGLAWTAFAARVLTRRRPLYARDRVLAARLALTTSTAVTATATTITAVRSAPAATILTTGLAGATLMALAATALIRAEARRRGLERLLAGAEVDPPGA